MPDPAGDRRVRSAVPYGGAQRGGARRRPRHRGRAARRMTAAGTRPDGSELAGLAVRAARVAGAAIRRLAARPVGVGSKSTPTDPATDADRAAESAIVELLAAERPHDGILAEEGAVRESRTGLRWVIDP